MAIIPRYHAFRCGQEGGFYRSAARPRQGEPRDLGLGNHDFYHGSIATVRNEVADVASRSQHLVYLTRAGVVEITPTTCLVGHDGWSDGRLGDFFGSTIQLNDYILIDELKGLDRSDLLARLNALGDEAAEHLRRTLADAMASYSQIVVVTHVPPFREACWHRRRVSDDDGLPHFSCKATGEAIHEAARAWPDRMITVLCGHTHGSGEVQILDNLAVITAEAEYGSPIVQRTIVLG